MMMGARQPAAMHKEGPRASSCKACVRLAPLARASPPHSNFTALVRFTLTTNWSGLFSGLLQFAHTSPPTAYSHSLGSSRTRQTLPRSGTARAGPGTLLGQGPAWEGCAVPLCSPPLQMRIMAHAKQSTACHLLMLHGEFIGRHCCEASLLSPKLHA